MNINEINLQNAYRDYTNGIFTTLASTARG